MKSDVEQLLRRVGAKALEARLAAKLDPDYAAMMGERHAERVKVSDDGSVDPESVTAVAAEVIKAAGQKWQLGAGASESLAQLRMSLKAERDRERERTTEPSGIARLRANR